jgi:TolB protein
MNPDGSGRANLTNSANPELNLVWSPDGLQIAFVSNLQGNNDIFVINVDGSDLTNLTRSPDNDLDLDWYLR